MNYPKVAIIILNWNNWSDTIECLKSIEKINYPNFQTILIDNNSTDDSVKEIKRQFPQLALIENKENLGFAGGNNVGIRKALNEQADYILLLNNDTVVKPNFLKELIEIGENNSRFGILGPKIYFFNQPEKIWFGGGKLNWIRTKGTHINYNKVESPEEKETNNYQIVNYISGCCLLIKTEVIKKVGPMSEEYFLYYEDADWNLRAQKAGYFSVLVPAAKILHKASQSAKEGSFSYIYYHSRNGLLLAKKFNSFFKQIIVFTSSVWIFKKQIIKILFFPKKREWGKAVIKGIKDFYLGRLGPIR